MEGQEKARYEWDDDQAERNLDKHGIDFGAVEDFEWDKAVVFEDDREDYGECRYQAYGPIHGRLVVLAYTMRGAACRVISVRKANRREVNLYEQA
jgi:uncharacterized DUF497 family protein